MEGNSDILGVITEEGLKNPQGIIVVKIKDKSTQHYIWLWCSKKIEVYEITPAAAVELKGSSTWDDKLTKHEINLSCNIIDVFQLDEELVYVLDTEGVLHSYQIAINNTNSPMQYMDVDDLFNSPISCETSKWKESFVTKVKNCDRVIGSCHSTFGFAALVVKDEYLALHVYSFPDFTFKFFFDIHQYNSQNAVLSCCKTASLLPSLKMYFEDDLDVLDDEIIIVGLSSGVILWFSANNSTKAPITLFSAYHEVKNIHFIEEASNGLLSHMLVVLSSGSIIIFGEERVSTKYLPDSVKALFCLSNHLITSNLVDCYSSELKMSQTVDVTSVLLQVKGVSAMSKSFDSETLLAATAHGTVYCLDIKAKLPETAACFSIPEEHLVENMLTQAKKLDVIYKQLADQDSILKAVSTAMTANTLQLFTLTLKVISDNEFCLATTLTKTGVVFSHKLWLANVEITGKHGHKENLQIKFTKDFSYDSELQLNVKQSLSIGDVVSLDLMLFLIPQQPKIIVPIDKVEIDAGYLMAYQVLVPNIISIDESFEEILCNLNGESSTKRRLQEWKLCLKIPDKLIINSVLPSILKNSQQRIPKDEWDKLVGGKKHGIQLKLDSQTVLIHLELESKKLTITSCDIQLCYQVKDAALKRLKTSEDKYICENLALEVQALNQEFEIESFKDVQDLQTLEIIRKRLRSTVSCNFLS